jgi:hypothetical protein
MIADLLETDKNIKAELERLDWQERDPKLSEPARAYIHGIQRAFEWLKSNQYGSLNDHTAHTSPKLR